MTVDEFKSLKPGDRVKFNITEMSASFRGGKDYEVGGLYFQNMNYRDTVGVVKDEYGCNNGHHYSLFTIDRGGPW